MKTTYDKELAVEISEEFLTALHMLMAAQLAMMRAADEMNADCWTWGRCEIKDLASARPLIFEFGGEEDKPVGMKGCTQVLVFNVTVEGPPVGGPDQTPS